MYLLYYCVHLCIVCLLIWSSLNNSYNVFNYCVCNSIIFASQEVQLLTVLHILMTLYQDVNATEVQDEKLAKFRRKVLSTAIKDNINEVWSILHHTLTVSGSSIRIGRYYFQSWYPRQCITSVNKILQQQLQNV